MRVEWSGQKHRDRPSIDIYLCADDRKKGSRVEEEEQSNTYRKQSACHAGLEWRWWSLVGVLLLRD